jgi:hypothetical protein
MSLQYVLSWSEKADLIRKLDKVYNCARTLRHLSYQQSSVEDAVEFLAQEIEALSEEMGRVVSNVEKIPESESLD